MDLHIILCVITFCTRDCKMHNEEISINYRKELGYEVIPFVVGYDL